MKPRNQILNAIGSRAAPAFATQLGVGHEAIGAETISEADQYHAFARISGAVIHADAGGTSDEAAAVNPYDDRNPFAGRFGRCPDVHIQAIFADRRGIALRMRCLHAGIRESIGLPDARPGLDRRRGSPAQIAHRRSGEWNALENRDAILCGPTDGTTGDLGLGDVREGCCDG